MAAQSNEISSAVEPRIVGRYALFDEIAAGGMATIHLGRLMGSTGFSRTVAIKTLHPQFARDPEFVEMFLQEARLASRIQHPNVISTLDRTIDNGEAFLVMEYVAGESLAKLVRASLKKGHLVPNEVAVSILSGTLHGLHATHEATNENREPMDIVHRDVSPQNILVGLDGVARIFDFGVAKAAAMKSQATADGQMKGKLSYMSPEQLNSKTVDRRTDVFAAGVVAWECVAGRRLFSGSDPGEVLAKVLTLDIPSPRDSQPNVPENLSNAIMKSLARDPSDRWQTAREFAIALEEIGQLAPSHVVGQWVERYASEALQERRTRVESVERASMELEAIRIPTVGSESTSASVNTGPSASHESVAESPPTDASLQALEPSSNAARPVDAGELPQGAAPEIQQAFREGTGTASAASISISATANSSRKSSPKQWWVPLLVAFLAATSIAGGVWYRQSNGNGNSRFGSQGLRSGQSNSSLPSTAIPTADLYYRGDQNIGPKETAGNEAANPRAPEIDASAATQGSKDNSDAARSSDSTADGSAAQGADESAPDAEAKSRDDGEQPPVVEAKDLPEQTERAAAEEDTGISPINELGVPSSLSSKNKTALARRKQASARRARLAKRRKQRLRKRKGKVALPRTKDPLNCDQPVAIDKNGIRRIRPECI